MRNLITAGLLSLFGTCLYGQWLPNPIKWNLINGVKVGDSLILDNYESLSSTDTVVLIAVEGGVVDTRPLSQFGGSQGLQDVVQVDSINEAGIIQRGEGAFVWFQKDANGFFAPIYMGDNARNAETQTLSEPAIIIGQNHSSVDGKGGMILLGTNIDIEAPSATGVLANIFVGENISTFDNGVSLVNSAIFGEDHTVSGLHHLVGGDNHYVDGRQNLISGFGHTATNRNQVITGANSISHGRNTTLHGWSLIGNSFSATYLGTYNLDSAGNKNAIDATDPLFVIGNGTGSEDRSDALVILKNGTATADTTWEFETGINSPYIQATGSNGTAMKNNAGTSIFTVGSGGGENATLSGNLVFNNGAKVADTLVIQDYSEAEGSKYLLVINGDTTAGMSGPNIGMEIKGHRPRIKFTGSSADGNITFLNTSLDLRTESSAATVRIVPNNTIVATFNGSGGQSITFDAQLSMNDNFLSFGDEVTGDANLGVGRIYTTSTDDYKGNLVFQVKEAADSNYTTVAEMDSTLTTTFAGGVVLPATGNLYFGSQDVDGTWRIVRNGSNLIVQRRETGSYVTKQAFTAGNPVDPQDLVTLSYFNANQTGGGAASPADTIVLNGETDTIKAANSDALYLSYGNAIDDTLFLDTNLELDSLGLVYVEKVYGSGSTFIYAGSTNRLITIENSAGNTGQRIELAAPGDAVMIRYLGRIEGTRYFTAIGKYEE